MSPTVARRTLRVREVLRGRGLNAYDLVLAVGIVALGYVVIKLGQSMTVNYAPGRTNVVLNTDISNVPYYAARSLLRMFIALSLSTIFTLVYGTAAARLRRAEKVLVPILDILQSVPILIFLADRPDAVHQDLPEQPARRRARGDLRDLHGAGLEHDLQLLPLAHQPADRAR